MNAIGASMGCVMEEKEISGIPVVRVHKVLPEAPFGIEVGDIVTSVDGTRASFCVSRVGESLCVFAVGLSIDQFVHT